jgi:hypothetical protein
MKNAMIAPLLVLSALSSLPNGALSFTARPLANNNNAIRTANSASSSSRQPTHLHGLLPGFLSRNKEETDESEAPMATEAAISPKMTELAMETVPEEEEEEEELSETKKMLQKVKQAGTAGAISYALWELAFWGVSLPVCIVGYRELTGHWPDFSNSEDMQKVGAEAFAFVNFARLAVPLRIGLALSTTGWIDENLVQKFMKKGEDDSEGSDE